MLEELLKRDRSFRSFDENRPISPEEMKKIAAVGCLCPSTANLQVIKLREVTNKDELELLLENTGWAGYLKDEKLPPEGHSPTGYMVVCIDRNISGASPIFYKDVGICAQAMLLRACELGLGGCMIGTYKEDVLKKALGIGDGLEIALVIALGKPDEEVELCPVSEDGSIKYYRKNGVHYVPKRGLEELLI